MTQFDDPAGGLFVVRLLGKIPRNTGEQVGTLKGIGHCVQILCPDRLALFETESKYGISRQTLGARSPTSAGVSSAAKAAARPAWRSTGPGAGGAWAG